MVFLAKPLLGGVDPAVKCARRCPGNFQAPQALESFRRSECVAVVFCDRLLQRAPETNIPLFKRDPGAFVLEALNAEETLLAL